MCSKHYLIVLWLAVATLAASARPAEPAGKSERRLPGHRTLFNADCNFLFRDVYLPDRQAKYDRQILHRYIDRLADSGVDTYLANPNGQVPWYPSKRTPNILSGYRRGDGEFVRRHFGSDCSAEVLARVTADHVRMLDRFLDLAEAGVDWLTEISQACRRRNVSPWLSIRMNDLHGSNDWAGSYLNCALQRDPHYRLSGREANPRDGINPRQQALNYAHREVRDYMLLVIREAVEDHDFEGLELDWLRCPFCCEAPATAEQTATITAWIGEIRALAQAQAKKTGRPYPLGLRLPCRLGLLRAIGLDVPALARAGLIDFVGVSNFWQTSWDLPYEELRRELGQRVAIYGVVEAAPNWLFARDAQNTKQSYRLLPCSAELLRGNAAGELALGVDGIECFNFFCADHPNHNPAAATLQARYGELRHVADLDALRGQPKQYTLASMQGYFMFPLYEFAEQVPALLEPGAQRTFRLSMCAEPADKNLEWVVQLVVEKSDPPADLGVSVNGGWPNFAAQETDRLLFPAGMYTHHLAGHRALDYRFSVAEIREGWNEIVVFDGRHPANTVQERPRDAVRILSVELAVRSAK